MTLTDYPVGLHAKTDFFVCDSTTYNAETREFILSRMKATVNNIKPVFVVEADQSVTMYETNPVLNQLTMKIPRGEEVFYKMRVENRARFFKARTRIQKDNTLTNAEKEILIDNL